MLCLMGSPASGASMSAYGRKELAQVAYSRCSSSLLQHVFQDGECTDGAARRGDLSALGHDLKHVFFNTSGSEAIDTRVSPVRHY